MWLSEFADKKTADNEVHLYIHFLSIVLKDLTLIFIFK